MAEFRIPESTDDSAELLAFTRSGEPVFLTLQRRPHRMVVEELRRLFVSEPIQLADFLHSGAGFMLDPKTQEHCIYRFFPNFRLRTHWVAVRIMRGENEPVVEYHPSWSHVPGSVFESVMIEAPEEGMFVGAYFPRDGQFFFGLSTHERVYRLPVTNCYENASMCIPYLGRSHGLNALNAYIERLSEFEWNADLLQATPNMEAHSGTLFAADLNLVHIPKDIGTWKLHSQLATKSMFKLLTLRS